MEKARFLINYIICLGIASTILGCSNEMDSSDIYSTKEFHEEVAQLQNKYNSSLKIDESFLNRDDETLTNINDILRTIENSCFEYELIVSEDGGLIAMPILTTAAISSSSFEMTSSTYSEIISGDVFPCKIKIVCKGQKLSIITLDSRYVLINISCRGSVTEAYADVSGDFMIRSTDSSVCIYYSIYRRKSKQEDILNITRKD